VPKTTEKREIKVTVDIRPGPVSPAQAAAWYQLWAKLLRIEQAPAPGREDRGGEGDGTEPPKSGRQTPLPAVKPFVPGGKR
jgi:hypothetical protein